VETIPPAERELIISYYLEEQKEKQKRQEQANKGTTIGTPIDPMGE
jgi:hypothetical protein